MPDITLLRLKNILFAVNKRHCSLSISPSSQRSVSSSLLIANHRRYTCQQAAALDAARACRFESSLSAVSYRYRQSDIISHENIGGEYVFNIPHAAAEVQRCLTSKQACFREFSGCAAATFFMPPNSVAVNAKLLKQIFGKFSEYPLNYRETDALPRRFSTVKLSNNRTSFIKNFRLRHFFTTKQHSLLPPSNRSFCAFSLRLSSSPVPLQKSSFADMPWVILRSTAIGSVAILRQQLLHADKIGLQFFMCFFYCNTP